MSEKKIKKVRKMTASLELSSHVVGAHNIDEVINGIVKKDKAPTFLVIDLFCGAGGTSTGFENTNGDALVIACVNHDFKAIKSHWINYPEIAHFEEDIRILDLRPLVKLLNYYRRLYPDAKVVLWASLECTNFSKAKGGQPRDADSRTLADHLHRYITALNPDYIEIENVVEFMSWGPLDDNGKPLSKKNGEDFVKWCNSVKAHGYYNEWKEMNSADYGAYTSRNRLFGIFARPDLPITWPEPTHAKKPEKASLYSSLKKWMPVKDVLDFSDEGHSIFGRKKDLSEKTLQRIYAGLLKYVAGMNQSAFIAKYYSGRPEGKVISVEGPAGVIATAGNQSLVNCSFLANYHHSSDVNSIEDPSPTLVTRDKLAIIQPDFLAGYYGNGDNISSVEDPCNTIPTKDRFGLVQPKYFIDKQYGGDANHQSLNQPAGVIMQNDKHCLVEATPFIMRTGFDNQPSSIEEPAPTLLASRKHHYIINPSHGGNNSSVDAPCPVIVARQDKAPLYLLEAQAGAMQVPIYESDSEFTVKIKEFMALYGIVDIRMRMLKVLELLKIQGFPAGYILEGNQSDQKKFIGNSVVPHVVKSWAMAMAERVRNVEQKVA
jgi:DNA (cytosine-5)-methyltransferase 1